VSRTSDLLYQAVSARTVVAGVLVQLARVAGGEAYGTVCAISLDTTALLIDLSPLERAQASLAGDATRHGTNDDDDDDNNNNNADDTSRSDRAGRDALPATLVVIGAANKQAHNAVQDPTVEYLEDVRWLIVCIVEVTFDSANNDW
jgi:hypothetical protein